MLGFFPSRYQIPAVKVGNSSCLLVLTDDHDVGAETNVEPGLEWGNRAKAELESDCVGVSV